jgi:hypothetical protein
VCHVPGPRGNSLGYFCPSRASSQCFSQASGDAEIGHIYGHKSHLNGGSVIAGDKKYSQDLLLLLGTENECWVMQSALDKE